MKSRSVKLREAHKPSPSGRASFSSLLWDHQALHLVTASSSDASISVHDPLLPSDSPKILSHHRDGITSLAISPNSTCLASGSIDRSVKLYKFPSGEFQTNITRFTLPIRTLAFNKSGSMLAAAGDDEGIKLINTVDGSIARVLKGHKGSITCLAFDPVGEYLASLDSTGTVIYWELQSGMILHTLKGAAPNCSSDYSVINVLCWSPDGETLAVPGLKNDVVMYDRDTAERLFSLKGDHSEPVCYLTWSPNGKYLATSASDRQVLIWDVDKKQDIDRQKFDENICCMAWKPIGNALAIIDTTGKYGVWESVIPSSMKSPVEGIPNLRLKNGNGLLLYDEDEDEELTAQGSISDAGDDSCSDSGLPSRKRLRKTSYGEYWEEEGIDELRSPKKPKSHKGNQKVKPDDRKEGSGRADPSMRSTMQGAFQTGSTPVQLGKRHFLCYNIIGCITTMEQEGYSHVEIDFHDTSKGPRVPSMTDHFGFTMASINETGSVFANLCKGDKNLSTLMYRPLVSYFPQGFLKTYTTQYGGSWVPIFSANKVKKSDENYWMVGFNSSNVFCIVCTSPDSFPQVTPKPILTLLNFSTPLASSDIGAEALENEFMLNYIHLSQIHKRIDEAAHAGFDTGSLDDDAFNIEAAQDKCILRLIASCCNSDKLARASELVKLLFLEKSVRGAIKLATALKLPNLAERFNCILEERMLDEKKSVARGDCGTRASSGFITDTTSAPAVSGTFEVAAAPSTVPALSAPLFIKKSKSRENNDIAHKRIDPGASARAGDCVAKQTNEDASTSKKPDIKRPTHPPQKPTDGMGLEKKSSTEGTQQLPRPSNPFLKTAVK